MGRVHVTPKQFAEILTRIADRNIGAVERAFLRSVEVSINSIKTELLLDALRRRDVGAVFDAVHLNGQLEPRLKRSLEQALRTVFNQAAQATALSMPPEINVSFNLVNPRAVRWARNYAADLVTQVSKTAKANIARIVARGVQRGVPIPQSSREIAKVLARSVKRTLGLTEPQFKSLGSFEEQLRKRAAVSKLLRDGVERSEIATQLDVTPQYVGRLANRKWLWIDEAIVEARVERRAKQLLGQRATTIARTGTLAAANNGSQETWLQAADAGFIDAQTTRRRFLVARDDRLCPNCKAVPGLNADGVGLTEPFVTPLGLFLVPPLHPRCRCTVRLVAETITPRVRQAA